jgi:hypothetical protein
MFQHNTNIKIVNAIIFFRQKRDFCVAVFLLVKIMFGEEDFYAFAFGITHMSEQ